MAQRRGISGDEIRREQEESRRRSRLGGRDGARQLQPSVSIIVTGIEIDWLMPLVASVALGFGKVGLVLAAVAIGLDFFSSRIVTIECDDEGVHAIIRKPWQRAARAHHLVIDAARLRYWNAWFCRGLEVIGANVSVVASGKRGRWLRPPLGVPAASVRPRFRPTARSIALNLPNLLLNAGTIAAVWSVGPYSLLIAFVALNSTLSSLANCLFGGPELVIAPPEYQRRVPGDHSAQAA
jgi:hypothetical protein